MLFLFLMFSFSFSFSSAFLAFSCCQEREYLPCILLLEFWSARSSSEFAVSLWGTKKHRFHLPTVLPENTSVKGCH